MHVASDRGFVMCSRSRRWRGALGSLLGNTQMLIEPYVVRAVSALMILLTSTAATAAEYLTQVTSEVYQTPGAPREIATKAQTCIAQHLKPGMVNAPQIVSSDLDNGLIVARSALEYPDGLLSWQVRSTFTFEAREGRFRIVQTNLERFQDQFNVGWKGIGKWTGSGWKKAEAAFQLSASVVASCVMNGPKREDW